MAQTTSIQTNGHRGALMYISIFALVLGFAWNYMIITHGFDVSDEGWQIFNSKHPEECPHGLLTHHFGHIWGAVFGYSFISFRILTMLLKYASFIVYTIPLYRYTRNPWLTVLSFAFLCLLVPDMLWGFDVVTRLFCAIVVVLSLCWYKSASTRTLVLLGVACGFFSLVRIPGLAVIPVEFCLLAFCCYLRKDPLKRSIGYAVVFGMAMTATIVALLFVFAGSPMQYAVDVMTFNDSTHGVGTILGNYVLDLIYNIAGPLLGISGLYFVFGYIYRANHRAGTSIKPAQAFWYGIFLLAACYYLYIGHFFLGYFDRMAGVCLMLFLLGGYVYCAKGSRISVLLPVATILAVTFIPIVASDTGLRKWPILHAFPIALLFFIQTGRKKTVRFIYLVLLAMILVGIGSLYRTYELYSDRGYRFATYKMEEYGIYTTPELAAYIREVNGLRTDYEKAGKSVMFLGNSKKWLFEFLADKRENNFKYDSKLDVFNETYRDGTVKYLTANPRDVVIVLFKGGRYSSYTPDITVTETALLDMGYTLIKDTGTYRLYELSQSSGE